MKVIAFTRNAMKTMRGLPKTAQVAILAILAKLERYAEEGAGNTKALVGQPGIRIRAGDYRAVFEETEETIEVFAVGHRSDSTTERAEP